MDVDNPWQVVSIEAFYCLKCPECMFFTTEDNAFYEHAVKNHPLSGVLFGKPRDETVDPEEILNFLVKNEPPENSSENEHNETFETIIEDSIVKNEPPEDSFENENNETLSEKTFETIVEDSNGKIELVKAESYEPFSCKFCVESFSDLNNMKMHLKVHAKAVLYQPNISERLYFKNLRDLNQGEIPNANKLENLETFAETRHGIQESSIEVKSKSMIITSQTKLHERDKSEIDVKSASNETEGYGNMGCLVFKRGTQI